MIFKPNYIEKAKKLNISHNFMAKAVQHHNKNIMKLVRYSKNQTEFTINIEGELYNTLESTPYDFTYLMGLEFGVYNMYQPQEISPAIKKGVVLAKPNPVDTRNLLENNKHAIAIYLCEVYELNKDYIYQTMDQMFLLHKKNPNFSNDVAIEIGKMVSAYYMCFRGKSIATTSKVVHDFFEEGQAIRYFRNHNKIDHYHK